MITDDIEGMYHRIKWSLVLRGLFALAVGFFILARPADSIAVFALVIAFWALLDGISNIVHAFDLRAIASHWWVLLIAGLVSAVFGVAALYAYPVLSLAFAVAWTSFWLITAGALSAYVAFQERKVGMSWGWTMTLGLITIAAGILAIMYPGITLASLIGVIGGFAIVIGIVRLVAAGRLQSFEHRVNQAVQSPARM